VIPRLLLAALPPPAARVRALPGRPRRKLTTGVRAGAGADPAIRAFRTALSQAIRSTSANAVDLTGQTSAVAGRHRCPSGYCERKVVL
jgi:hypothetical protein